MAEENNKSGGLLAAHDGEVEGPAVESGRKGAPLRLSGLPCTLFSALLEARRASGGSTDILQDHNSDPITYDALVRAAYALGARIARMTSPRETVGVLLPTSAPAVIVLFALQAAGRVAAVLNYRLGASELEAACAVAGVKRLITSRRFIEAAGLERVASKLESSVSLVYAEDLRRSVTMIDRLIAGLRSFLPAGALERSKPDDPAVILFTSGTTGAPKGVALSHANLLANIAQCRAHVPFDPKWIFFNALPMFHAFGLTGGILLPILGGMKTVLYPSPLDHERIPKIIRATGANVLVSTDTFARFYARAADADALAGLHYVVLGGERMNEETRRLFAQKSTALVLQGYGATECAPVIAFNQPDADRSGTVGKLLPGMEARLEPMPGVAIGGRLFVRGPNVMLGYLDPERRGEIARRPDDWFDTGDLATIDEDGFLTLIGRVKRFARIGAEMVSLDAVEEYARSVWPAGGHAALSVARPEGGEAIVLVTDQKEAERSDYASWVRMHDVSQLAVPRYILVVRRLPLLPTGKPDYAVLRRIIKKKLGKAGAFEDHSNGEPGDAGKMRST